MNNISDRFINNENLNTSDDGSEKANEEFADKTLLTIDEIIINLKIISKIKENDKMIVNNKTMTVD